MEIKGIHDLYPYRSVGNMGRGARANAIDSVQASRESGEEVDKINISPEASFRAKLDSVAKNYAEDSKRYEAGTAERVAALKEQYQGDNCPVSGQDVARAIMNMVLGR